MCEVAERNRGRQRHTSYIWTEVLEISDTLILLCILCVGARATSVHATCDDTPPKQQVTKEH